MKRRKSKPKIKHKPKLESTSQPSWAMSGPGSKEAPFSSLTTFNIPNVEEVYKQFENPKTTALAEVMREISSGHAVVEDAILFTGRFNESGMLLREKGKKPYQLAHVRGMRQYNKLMRESDGEWKGLPIKAQEAREDFKARERALSKLRKRPARETFTSGSDLGSNYSPDPNQYTEYTPFFNGPFEKQQYFDYFQGHSYAFQLVNHNPVAKRIIDILVQYTLGRGFKIKCKNDKISDAWNKFNTDNKITYKMRKYWLRELLIYGENFIDVLRWISVDPSTIYDIICEGYDEFIDQPLYYQQMFQTATQMYAGIQVPGVPGSKDTKVGHYIIRQIPYDQILHIKANVVSVEKRGRSILYSVLGWLKRLTDTLEARALGEQLRASFVWDDTVDGTAADVASHAAKYAYIPIAPSIFIHSKSIERKPLAPMAGINGNGASDVVNEILCLIATGMGIAKDQFNVLTTGGGSRATAIVGSEPFTKVIEDLQEDCNDLLHRIIDQFCKQNTFEYNEGDWQVIFPSVVKDSTQDKLENIGYCESMGWFSPERCATMAASELEQDDYNFDDEMKAIKEHQKDMMQGSVGWKPAPLPPPGRNGTQAPGNGDDPDNQNPLHGQGKTKAIAQHKKL